MFAFQTDKNTLILRITWLFICNHRLKRKVKCLVTDGQPFLHTLTIQQRTQEIISLVAWKHMHVRRQDLFDLFKLSPASRLSSIPLETASKIKSTWEQRDVWCTGHRLLKCTSKFMGESIPPWSSITERNDGCSDLTWSVVRNGALLGLH